jgi:ABC-type sulfate transport system permease component
MLTLRAMAVAAGVITVPLLFTIWTAIDLPTQSFGSAVLNGPYDPALAISQGICMFSAILNSIFAKNVGQF